MAANPVAARHTATAHPDHPRIRDGQPSIQGGTMIETTLGSWTMLLLLGALHGINPGMGWLFAVALGLQEEDGRAVWRSLLPLAIGHGLAIAVTVAVAVIVGLVLSPEVLRWIVAGALFGMGVFQLRRHRHPRWGGMRVSMRDLAIWSFLMASAHGAGLMALPFVPEFSPSIPEVQASMPQAAATHAAHGHGAAAVPVGSGRAPAGRGAHASHLPAAAGSGVWVGLLATLIHTVGYLLVTGAIAAFVFYRLGLRLLQRAWLNLDVIWAGALIVTAVMIPLF
jgi:hypothetical protein